MKPSLLYLWLIILISAVIYSLTIPVYMTANHPFKIVLVFIILISISLFFLIWKIDSSAKIIDAFYIIRNTNPKLSSWIITPLFLILWLVAPFYLYLNFEKNRELELEKYGAKSKGFIMSTWTIPGKYRSNYNCKISHNVDDKIYYFNDELERDGSANGYNKDVAIIYSKRYPNVGKIDKQK